ncbi:MAG: sulfatase-like hydrolase/transferase [Candidatus Hydrogenedens sp.]|nr:sulfatase-like hydrolase/transferase [Candidatus Hydrogenedens sp.]
MRWCLLFAAVLASGVARAEAPRPNFVVFFLDDSGYSDFQPFGHPRFDTPNMRRLAEEGRRFTQFYVPQAICSASRAALLSGCYPQRTKVFGAHGPGARGLEPAFPTLAEVLKPAGYATAVFGKWHIGDQEDTRPPARGFDESCGLMYSNDMWAGHPEHPEKWGKVPLQFYENGEVIIDSVTAEDQKTLTRRYTEHAVDFIGRHKEAPFFLYVPHNMPHVPLFCSPEFEGKSGAGLYGDVLLELDWSLGQILDALDAAGVADNTVVLFTSDNGPWTSYGNHAGSTPFREAKGTSFDGGVRSACIVRWPGHVPAGTVSPDTWCTIDVAPTFAALAGTSFATEIDGRDVWPLVTGQSGATNPHEAYYLTNNASFESVLTGDGQWKLHLPHGYRQVETFGRDGQPGQYRQIKIEQSLYHLDADPYEVHNVIEAHPEVAERLEALAETHREAFFARR